MKQKVSHFLIVLCVCCMLLCSCNISWGYPVIPFIPDDVAPEELLEGPEYDGIRFGSAVIVPSLRVMNHEEYQLAFFVYSEEEIEEVRIDSVSLANNGKEIPLSKTELLIPANDKEGSLFFGSERLCTIPQDVLNASRGDDLTLTIQVSAEEPFSARKTVVYHAKAYQTLGPAWPT